MLKIELFDLQHSHISGIIFLIPKITFGKMQKETIEMKKLVSLLLVLTMLFACSAAVAETAPNPNEMKIMVLVPSFENTYFVAAVNGAEALKAQYPGLVVDKAEMGAIPMSEASAERELAQYLPFFEDACKAGDYDLIITSGAECNHALLDVAARYPEQLFLAVDMQNVPESLKAAPMSNVYGLTYKNRDLGYLAGYVAAQVTTSDMPNANPDKKVGVIVGIDMPGLNEYIGSFCQVCKEQGVTVYIDYAGDFVPDFQPIVAEKAKAMYADGVDVIWQVAGSAGSGVFTAAAECGKYAFGVDCDQTLSITNEAEKATIVTSFYADATAVIETTFNAILEGKFPGGNYPQVGLAEGFVGYANNDQFKAMTNETIVSAIADLYAKASESTLEIFSVEADPEGWEALKADVAPAK